MQQIPKTSEFITTFKEIADNPAAALNKFQVIENTPKITYSVDYTKSLIAIFFTAVTGLLLKTRSPALIAVVPVTTYAIYNSFNPEKVEDENFSNQTKEINNYFNPCIENLKNQFLKKYEVIKNTIHDKSKTDLADVKNSIENVAAIYDGLNKTNSNLDTLVGERELGLELYSSLKESANKLTGFDISIVSDREKIAPLALQKLEKLKSISNLFLNGENKGTNTDGEDAYVLYGWDNKAIIYDPRSS